MANNVPKKIIYDNRICFRLKSAPEEEWDITPVVPSQSICAEDSQEWVVATAGWRYVSLGGIVYMKTSRYNDELFPSSRASILTTVTMPPMETHIGPVPTIPLPIPLLAAQVTNTPLMLGFDLPLNVGAGLALNRPSNANHPGMSVIRARWAWDPEHEVYAWELMERAMCILGRGLRIGDFIAITEALHRRFPPDNITTPYRGYNTIHSRFAHSTEDWEYAALLRWVGL